MPESSGQLRIRLATVEDIPALCELLGLLFAQEADFSPDPARQEQGLRLILDEPRAGLVFCATDGDTVIGTAGILFTVSTAEGGRAAVLEDLIVHPDWRGHGIGQRLVQEAIARAREAGCKRITLLTDATNEAAMRLYGQSGFVRSGMVTFRLTL